MRRLIGALAILIVLAAARSFAQDCCSHCGCNCGCHKVCRVICETKKVPKICYTCECEDFCVPGPSTKCGEHCVCDPCDPCGKPKKVIDWSPGCATQYTRHKLVKHETTEEVKSFKWVVENVCDRCAAHDPAPTPAPPQATTPAPGQANPSEVMPLPPVPAPLAASRPLTEDDLKKTRWRSKLTLGLVK